MRSKWLHCLFFVMIFFVLNALIGAFLKTPKQVLIRMKKYDPYWRWQEFYALPPHSVDTLFLGSSHCYRSFDPAQIDAALGTVSFNMGSSSQTPVTSYYVLKEVLNSQTPKRLVFEIYWQTFAIREQFTNATYNLEEMRSWDNRAELMRDAYRGDDLLNLVLPSMRYKYNLQDSIRHMLGRTVAFVKDDVYAGRGYVANGAVADEGSLRNDNPFKDYIFKTSAVLDVHLAYLQKIVDLCRARGIDIVFVTAPIAPSSRAMIKNYGDIHAFFAAIAERNGIPYFDYNTGGEAALFTDLDFKDADHLNVNGVKKFDGDLVGKLRALVSK